MTIAQAVHASRFGHGPPGGATPQETNPDGIGNVLGALSTGTLTASDLCVGYIQR